MSKEDRVPVYFIPKNFKTGISLFGTTFETKNIIEMNIVCIPITIFIFFGLEYRFSTKLSIVIVIDLIVGYLCLVGINERPLFSYINSWYTFHKTRVHAYYNYRIKIEARPSFIESDEGTLLPKEKLQKLYERFKEKYDEKEQAKVVQLQILIQKERESFYFLDDIGIVDKPVEYMNNKEYRKYQKLQKKKGMRSDENKKEDSKKERKASIQKASIFHATSSSNQRYLQRNHHYKRR